MIFVKESYGCNKLFLKSVSESIRVPIWSLGYERQRAICITFSTKTIVSLFFLFFRQYYVEHRTSCIRRQQVDESERTFVPRESMCCRTLLAEAQLG